MKEVDTASLDLTLLKKRGPDSFRLLVRSCPIGDVDYTLVLAASVLSLRGGAHTTQVTEQPLVDAHTGNILLWNGEIFASDRLHVASDQNDTQALLAELSKHTSVVEAEQRLLSLVESIKGPYAFVFYHSASQKVFFGRDKLGRRSLLISTGDAHGIASNLALSSVKVNWSAMQWLGNFEELRANGVYVLRLGDASLQLHEWRRRQRVEVDELEEESELRYYSRVRLSRDLFLLDTTRAFNEDTTEGGRGDNEASLDADADELLAVLKQSVARRVSHLPNNCKECVALLCRQSGASPIKFNALPRCRHAKLAVLFSGGVDSAVLAALADMCLPPDEPIDLLNVAFEQQQKPEQPEAQRRKAATATATKAKQSGVDRFLVPDRVSGLRTLGELNPNREWNFVEINVSLDELREHRDSLIKHLLYPHQSVLDDSIGCAIWFASRGRGRLAAASSSSSSLLPYTSNAEILLLGMGADEQLAGYARHRTRYELEGAAALCQELKMEMKRISHRNLGNFNCKLIQREKQESEIYLYVLICIFERQR